MTDDLTPEAVELLARECNLSAFRLADHEDGPVLGRARDTLRALAARLAELEAEKREMAMQSLADLGQAQEAYEAQRAAEARAEAAEAALAEAQATLAEAHDEQLGVWADELMADLILDGLMDLVNHDYDTKVQARRTISDALKSANQAKVPRTAALETEAQKDAELARLRHLIPEVLASLDASGCNISLARDLRAALDEDARHG